MIAAALATIAAGLLLVRLGWGGARGAAAAGWALVALALAVLAMREGAWGLALGTVAGIAAAMAIVFAAAGRTRPHPHRTARTPPIVRQRIAIGNVARRLAVFALVVPAGFAASAWLAVAVHHAARAYGMAPADAAVCGWFALPVVWTALIAAQLTRVDPRAMLAPLAVAAGTGALLWWAA